MTGPGVRLAAEELHPALSDPVLDAMSFLNEIMARHPDAVSFAPGAPHLSHFDDLDPDRYVRRYVAHVAARRGVSERRARQVLFEYGPSRGLIGDLVARALHADYGCAVPERSVVITVGAQEAMFLALRVLGRTPDDVLAVVNPSYVGIIGAARLLGMPVVAVNDTDDGPDLAQLAAECRRLRAEGRRVRALYVAPDFANPSGTYLPAGARRRLLELAEREDFLILEDTAYGFTGPAARRAPTLKALDPGARVVLLGTFAKICLPGARVGFAVADQPVAAARGERLLADDLAAAKSMVTVNTSPLAQAVIGGMLLEHGGSLAALGRARAELYNANLAHLLDALERHATGPDLHGRVTWHRPRGGFFVRMRLPVPADAALLERCAAVHKVLWTPMSPFYLDGSGTHEIRLSCSYLDPGEIDDGVARLAGFLRSLPDTRRRSP
ncbi:aminotransferase-like domain-containing protein [Streptomyces litchfieldiae]|uniref:PLP-dependent aminotransferase family protein n=1 Tax=Streptomyces litchfieldiae TaxID=3075543 RepID=A0ABU2MUW7_9ACTN|nr:PLP-dependent aminotransferase family protein [Streptomyces sp. DSM 44938]MDT0345442.1 PLP-dependent aminotransferase family protein [Streptomyces sp. DSM 44938]